MRRRFGLILAVVAVMALALIAGLLLRGVMGMARLSVDSGSSEPDPMFAEPAELVTRPPDGFEGEAPVVSADEDPSQNWVYETLTPVEQTAAELAGAS